MNTPASSWANSESAVTAPVSPRPTAGHDAPTELPPSRHARTQGVGAPAVAAHLGRLAELHEQIAVTYRELAEVADIQLAVLHGPRLVDDVTPPSTGRLPALIGTKAMAEMLGVDQRTVRRWNREGIIPSAIELSSVLRWRRSDIERWIEEQTA